MAQPLLGDPLSKFRKIDVKSEQTTSLWNKLLNLAKLLETPLQSAFLDAVVKLKKQWVMNGEVDEAQFKALEQAINETVGRAGRTEVLRVTTKLAFETKDPTVQMLIKQEAGALIKEITASTKRGIQQAVAAGIRQGTGADAIARQIRPLIGLTANQTQAVMNYRHALENHPMETLRRALRDRRFDKPIEAGKPLTADQIDNMVSKYADRWLKYRSETIARTESIRVLELGRRAAWKQLLDSNQVQGTVKKTWYLAHDERVCPICAPIPDMNEGGVDYMEDFQTPIGPVPQGPMHPDCRCVIFYEVVSS